MSGKSHHGNSLVSSGWVFPSRSLIELSRVHTSTRFPHQRAVVLAKKEGDPILCLLHA